MKVDWLNENHDLYASILNSNMTCCFGLVNKRVEKSPVYYDLHTLMIMTYLDVLSYPFVYKAKTARHRNNLWKG